MMKTIRSVAVLLACFWLILPAVQAETPDQRLIGAWEEYQPSSNVVQFFADHTMKLYLTREEGGDQTPPIHFIGGSWSVKGPEGSYVVTMQLSANGRKLERQIALKFERGEMILIDDSMVETRHHRLKGPLPAKYVW